MFDGNHFFQSFFGNMGQPIQHVHEHIEHNDAILEIVNNWEHITNLYKEYKDNGLKNKQIDQFDHDLLKYIIYNNIDVLTFTNEQEFLNTNWRTQ